MTKWGEYSSEVQLILQRSGGWGGGNSGTGTSPPPVNSLTSGGGSGNNFGESSSIERQEICDFISTSMVNSQSQSSRRNCGATSLLQVTSGNQRRPPYTASQSVLIQCYLLL